MCYRTLVERLSDLLRGLGKRFLLSFIIVVAIPLALSSVISTQLINRRIGESTRETLQHDLKLAWEVYFARGHQMKFGMLQAAAEPVIQRMVKHRAEEGLKELMQAWKVYRPYIDLWLFTDSQGRIIASLNGESHGGKLVLNGLMAKALEEKEALISTEILSPEDFPGEDLSGMALIVVTPVLERGEVIGTIVTGDLIARDSWIPTTLKETLHWHLGDVGNRGTEPIVVVAQGEKVITPEKALLPAHILEELAANECYEGEENLGGISYLLALDPIRDNAGKIIGSLLVGVPKEHFSRLEKDNMEAMALIAFLGMAAALLVASFITARITKPIHSLVTAARRLAEGDLAVRAEVIGEDELAQLGIAFNQMAAQLQRLYTDLEQRIEDTTQELSALSAVTSTVSQSLELQEILTGTLDSLLKIMGLEGGSIRLLDEEAGRLVLQVARGYPPVAAQTEAIIERSQCLCGSASSSLEPILIEDLQKDGQMSGMNCVKTGYRSLLCLPLKWKGRELGVMSLASSLPGRYSARDIKFLASISQQISAAVENARLRRGLEELSKKTLQALEEERRRISRELHDEIGQALIAINFNLQSVSNDLLRSPEKVEARLRETVLIVEGIIGEIHRISYDLRPTMLDELGLIPTLNWYVKGFTQRAGIEVDLEADGEVEELNDELKTLLYRVVQEGLTNVAKHSQSGRARVELEKELALVRLNIEDDGVGFELQKGSSLGLSGMKERVKLAGGHLDIFSAPGQGTKLRIRIPCPYSIPEEIGKELGVQGGGS